MKRVFYILFILAMNVMIYYKPIRAEDSGLNDFQIKEQKGYKDECLLMAINCGKDFVTLEQKIEKLRKEISKGRSVYTDDELRILREQLENANKTLEYFKNEGASNRYQ